MYLLNCTSARDCWQQLIVNVTVIHAHLCSSRLKITCSSFQTCDQERLENRNRDVVTSAAIKTRAVLFTQTCSSKLGGKRHACCCTSPDFALFFCHPLLWCDPARVCSHAAISPSHDCDYGLSAMLLRELMANFTLWHAPELMAAVALTDTHEHRHALQAYMQTYTHTGADKQIKWRVY